MRNVKKLQSTFIACQPVVERMEQRVFLSASLSGTVIGTAGSYQNLGNTAAKAFDNNISTYFDAPTASGSYTGLKLTAPAVISQIKYAPRNGYAYRMVGGVFQASNTADFSSGVVTLYTIKTQPTNGTYTTVAIPNTQSFEYVRYLGPTNGDCNVAEVQFFGTASTGSATLEPNGTVVVNGTSGADTISVRYDVDASISANLLGLSITVNGQTQTIYGSTFKALQINSFDGNDSITVTNNTADELNDATPADFPIIINAGNGNDTISTAINYGHTSIDNSNVIPSVSIIAGNGDDTIDDESTYANYNVTVGNGNDSVSFDAGEGAINATVSAGNGNDLFSIGNESEFVTLNGGSGIDTVQVYDSNDSVTGTLGGKSILLKPLSADQQTVLTGTVYADTNGDGKYESGEPVAADAQVSFTWDSSVYTTTSNSDGSYSLTIPTGYYGDGQITGYGNTFSVSYFGELLDNINIALPQPLSGTNIGTAGSYKNDGNTIAKALDGNLSTYFDGPTANGNYVCRDLGSAKIISQIAYAPRAGYAYRMVGGIFQGSNSADFSSGVVNLYTITTQPTQGVLTVVPISNYNAYRYVRYLAPANSEGDVAEVQFFGSAPVAGATLEANGTLVVNGSANDDTITITVADNIAMSDGASSVTVQVNGQTQLFNPASINGIVINSGDGNDTITVTGEYEENKDYDPTDKYSTTINCGDGNDSVTTQLDEFFEQDFPSSVINLGSGNDTVDVYQNGAATLNGGAGNDTLNTDADEGLSMDVNGGSGGITASVGYYVYFDTFHGGAGINTLSEGPNNYETRSDYNLNGPDFTNIQYFNDNFDDRVEAGPTTRQITVSDASPTITGSSGDLLIDVEGGSPTINAGSGNTTVVIDQGGGTITGGSGNDTFYVAPGTFPVAINGGDGTNTAYTVPGDIVTNIQNLNPQATVLTGTLLATAGSYQNDGNTAAKAVDGNLSTYFDAPSANGDYVGYDLGAPKLIADVCYAPRAGLEDRMIGGVFQISDSPDFSNPTDIASITSAPIAGQLTFITLDKPVYARYIRYLSPNGSYGNVAEIQFLSPGGSLPGATLDANGTLVVNGTTAADTITVNYGIDPFYLAQNTITVTINGVTQEIDGQSLHQVIINAGDGNNSITVTGSEENDYPNASDISMTLNGGSGDDTVNVNVDTEDENYDEVGNLITVNTGDGNNTVNLIYNGHATINGGSGNDYMYAQGGAAATMNGGDGDDTMVSGSGGYAGVTAYGQGGNDTFINGDPDDYMDADGGTGTNTFELTGGAYANFFAGPVNLQTGTFSSGMLKNIQNVSGDAGSGLTIIGNDQNNVFDVTGDDLSLFGGGGDDTFDSRNDTDSYIDGGSGNDTAYTDPTDTVVNVEHINPHQTVPTKLSGTPIGTAGSYQNDGNTISKLFDGNLTNYFDGPTASGDWAGLDFGSPTVVTQVKYAPRVGFESRMVGGEIQASNSSDFSSGVVTLYTITAKPTAGVFTVQSLNNTTAYRYYRYLGPANSFGDLAELEFDG